MQSVINSKAKDEHPKEGFTKGDLTKDQGHCSQSGRYRQHHRHSNEYKAPGDSEAVDLDYMSQTLEDDAS